MPVYVDDILVVTKEEILNARDDNGMPFFNCWNSLRSTIARYANKPYGMKRLNRGGGRGKQMHIKFDTLSSELQEAIGDPRKGNHPLLKHFQVDEEAVFYYASFRTRNGGLDPEKQQRYITEASLLNAAVAFMEERRQMWERMQKSSMRGLEASVCVDILSFRPVLRNKFKREYTLPENEVRLKEKLRNYAKLEGEARYQFLISGQTGNSNASVKTLSQIQILESMFISQKHKPTPTEVADQYNAFLDGYVEVISKDTGEVYNPKDFGKLSLRTITSYLGSWHSRIATHSKRAGNRQQFIGNYLPYGSMYQPDFAGSIISVDDRNPPFWYAKGKRMWFYCAYDVGAHAFTAWVYGKTKEGIIVDFYRQIVRNYTAWGIPLPAEIECESSLNSSYRENMLADGAMFQYVRMEANKARGKYIERVWGKMRYEVDKKREGWLARPNALRESNQFGEDKVQIVPYDELAYQCLEDIQNWNNSLHPNQEKYPGMSRWEVFMENQNPDLRKETNWSMILPFIGYKTETSCKAGTIKLQRKEFFLGLNGQISTGDELIDLLEGVEGKELDVYWLDDHNGEVLKALVYLRGSNRMMCEAILKPKFHRAKIEQTAEDRKNMSLVMSYINTFSGFISRRKQEIEPVWVVDKRKKSVSTKFVIPGLGTNMYNADPLSEEDVEELPDPVLKPEETPMYEEVEVLDSNDYSMPLQSISNTFNKARLSKQLS